MPPAAAQDRSAEIGAGTAPQHVPPLGAAEILREGELKEAPQQRHRRVYRRLYNTMRRNRLDGGLLRDWIGVARALRATSSREGGDVAQFEAQLVELARRIGLTTPKGQS